MANLNRGPNVYVDEVASGVHSIAGVATSIAAFIDFFPQGQMNLAQRVLGFGDFTRQYGGIDARSEASYAIQQFFLNGGSEAWVVRTASGVFTSARVNILDAIAGAATLRLDAISPGTWGNNLRAVIDPLTATSFNLRVELMGVRDGEPVALQSETFTDLTMAAGARFVETVVNDVGNGSHLVRATAVAANLPQPVGTLSGALVAPVALTNATPRLSVTIGIEGTGTATFTNWTNPGTLEQVRSALEAAIRAARADVPAFARATVTIVNNRLRVLAGPARSDARITFAPGGADPMAAQLQLNPAPQFNALVSADIAVAAAFSGQMNVQIGAQGPFVLTLGGASIDPPTARTELEAALRAASPAPEFTGARVALHSEGAVRTLVVIPGTSAAPTPVFTAQAGGTNLEVNLGLDAAGAPATITLTGNIAAAPALPAASVASVTIGGATGNATTGALANTFGGIATELQAAIRAAAGGPAFANARVAHYSTGENRYVIWPGGAPALITFAAAPADATTVNELLLDAGNALANVQGYQLGTAAAIANTAQGAGIPGADGQPPDALALIGNQAAKTGLYALEDVDLFNILCIPRTAMRTGPLAITNLDGDNVIINAKQYCRQRRAFFIVDTPSNFNSFTAVQAWLNGQPGLRDDHYAVYFPRVQVPDFANGGRPRSIGASGPLAGLYSRIDASRGVWKAPAGIEATLDVIALDYQMTDLESGVLNAMGINCLRTFRASGHHAWGARTMRGVDAPASEYKYIPVRRLASFIGESLSSGTTWVIFEGNDEPLWAKIRLNVRAFMMQLFRQGAFQGSTPDTAFFVKCDAETTPQADRNLGIVNIDVGFAPLKPAEFVVIRIQQMRGDL